MYAPVPTRAAAASVPKARDGESRIDERERGRPRDETSTARARTMETEKIANSSRATPVGKPMYSAEDGLTASMSRGAVETRDTRKSRSRKKPSRAADSTRRSLT